MTDYPAVLTAMYPGALWSLAGDDYENLVWSSDGPMPSQAELDAAWPQVQADLAAAAAAKVAARESARAKLAALGLSDVEIAALGVG